MYSEIIKSYNLHQVCVVGAGYVGLTVAACLAFLGHKVSCIESNPLKLSMLVNGIIPIVEPSLDAMVADGIASGRLLFTDDMDYAMSGANLAMLCVGTPPRIDGDPDLTHLAEAARQVARAAKGDVVAVIKSTVPPGTCEAIELVCEDAAPENTRIRIASSPEFLRESHAVHDFLKPDRIVIGAADEDIIDLITELYPQNVPVVRCDRRGAEFIKYASNAFLAVKISFANEVAALCEHLGTESATVLEGVGLDHRIGSEFLRPGPGYGGSCLPKDVSGFQALGNSLGVCTRVVSAAQQVNEGVIGGIVAKITMSLGTIKGKRIAVLGLSFKEDTDDTRDSPALNLANRLVDAGASVFSYDPLAKTEFYTGNRVDSAMDAIAGSEAVVFATAWKEFSLLNPLEISNSMSGRIIFDAAGIVDIESYSNAGLIVYGIGRGAPTQFHPVVWPPLQWAHL